jgi:hypothetical protein
MERKVKRNLKQWWDDWALIDLIILGLSIISVVGYLNFRYMYPEYDEPWLELWSSISTDLFFAWVTIRLIDALIKRRDHREDVRRTLAGNLNYTLEIIQGFLPKAYQHDLERLRTEHYWAKRRSGARKRYMGQDEANRLDNAYAALELLVKDADKLTTTRQQEVKYRQELDRKIRELEPLRDKLNDDVNKIEKEIKNSPPTDKVLITREIIKTSKDILTNKEFSQFEDRLGELEQKIKKTNEEYSYFELPYIKAYLNHNLVFDPEVESILGDLQEFSSQDYSLLSKRIESSRANLSPDFLPAFLLDTLEKRIDIIVALIEAQRQVEASCQKAIDDLSLVRDDILEETVID